MNELLVSVAETGPSLAIRATVLFAEASGAAAEDYAEELVAVTARLPHGLPEPGLAVAMGRRHTIEGRVRSILADDRDRRPVRMVRAAVIGGVFAMLATVAAIVGPAADAEDAATRSVVRPAAAELPKDTNTIESLTPEQARKLVEEFPGVEVEFTGGPFGSYKLSKCLPLNGMKKLNADVARALAGYGKGPLLLNGLTALDADTAKALTAFSGDWLIIDGLTSLDAATAQVLVNTTAWQGSLPRVTMLDAETATVLADVKHLNLALDGLAALPADVASALARYRGTNLHLNGLTRLKVDAARSIAGFGRAGSTLALKGVTSVSADVAEALATSRASRLDLDGVTTLDAAAAEAIAKFKGNGGLSLAGLTTLDTDTAKTLAEFKGRCYLGINAQAQEVFFRTNPLTPETALVWAALSSGQLLAVTAFESPDSVAIAKALATRKGPLSLPNLKKISPKTLSALIEKEDIDIPLIETLELIPEPDGSPTEDFVIPERFQKR